VTAAAVTLCASGAVNIANRALTLSGTSIAGSGNRLTTGTGALTLKSTGGIGVALTPVLISSAAISFANGTAGGVYISDAIVGGTTVSGTNTINGGAVSVTETTAGITVGGTGISSNNGTVTLRSNTLTIGAAITSGTVATYLLPNTAGTAVSINGLAGYNLTQANLLAITASTIVVGEDATPTVTAGAVTLCASGAVNIANRALTLSGRSIIGSGNRLTTGTGFLTLKATNTGGIGTIAQPILTATSVLNFSNSVVTSGDVVISDSTVGGTSFFGTNSFLSGQVSLTQSGLIGLSIIGTGISTNNGIVTLRSNALTIGAAIATGTAATYLLPNTVNTAASIGGTAGFDLTQAELLNITASTIVVGEDATPAVTAAAVTLCASGAVNIANRALTLSGTSIVGSGNRLTTGTGLLTLKATTAGGIGTIAQPILSASSVVSFSNSAVATGDVVISDNTAGGTSFSGANGFLGGQVSLTQIGLIGLSIIGTGISSSNGAISLVADDMNLAAAISAGSGNVSFTSYTAARTINLGSAAAGNLSLVQAELNEVTTTGRLTCGDSSHTGQVLVSAALTESSANVGSFYLLSTGAGGTIAQTANLVGSGAFISISANNGISLSANITTNAQTIGLDAGSGSITLGSDAAIDSTNASGSPAGATITISSPISGAHQLLIQSGQASQSIGAQIGTPGTNLTSLTVQSDDIVLTADLYAASINLYTQSAGQSIGLGGGAGSYQLDDAEIAHLKAFATLTVGLSGTQSGLMTAQTVASPVPTGAIVLNSDSGGGGVLLTDSGAADALAAGSGNVTIRAGSYGIMASNATSGTYAEIKTSGWVSLNVASGANGIGTNGNRVEISGAAYVQAVNAAGANGAFYLGGVGDIVFANGTTNSQGGAIDVSGTGNIVLDVVGTALSATNAAIDLRAPVLLALDTTISSGSGNSTFHAAVNSAPATHHSLTVNATGTSEFDAVVGGIGGQEPSSLTTDAGGTTRLYANVTTTGGQTYNDNVVLYASPTLASTSNGTIEFAGTVLADAVASSRTLTVNTGGISQFDAAVGGVPAQALASLTTDAGGTTRLYANVTTTAGQTYNDGVVLYASPTLASTSNGTIEFASTVLADAAGNSRALTVNTGGTSWFNAAVGGTAGQELASLTTDSGGTTRLYANVTTTGAQTYNDAVTLFGNAQLVAGGSGTAIDFASTLSGAFNLQLDAGGSGAITVAGAVGATPLNLLRVINSAGATFQSTVAATTVTLTATTGTIEFDGGLTASTLNTAVAGYALSILGGCDITAAATLSNTGTIALGNLATDILLFRGGLTATSAAPRNIIGSIRSYASAIDLGASALYGDTIIDATDNLNPTYVAGNAITLGTISVGAGSPTLVVNAGNGAAATFTQSAATTIVATNLRIIANGNIGASMASPVSVQVTNLEAASYGGTAFLSNVGPVNVGFDFAGSAFEFLATPLPGGGIVTAAHSAGIAATGTVTFVKPSTATTGSFDATAPDLVITSTITANGGINLYPNANNLPIFLNNAGAGFSLATAELQNLVSTGTVTIGRSDGIATAVINIGSTGPINLTGRAYNLTLQGASSPAAFHFAATGNSLSLPSGTTLTFSNGGPVTTDSAAPTIDVAIAGASVLDAQNASSVGSAANPVRATVATLRTATTNGGAYVTAMGNLALGDATRPVSAANGAIVIVAGGAITMGAAVTTTDAGAVPRAISLTSTAGPSIAISQNIQAANSGRIDIISTVGAITRSGAAVVGAPASTSLLVLSAGSYIGVDAAPLNAVDPTWLFTDVGTIRGAALGGGIFISEASAAQLGDATAGLSATGGNIDVVAGGAITTGVAFAINAASATSDLFLSGSSLTIEASVGAGRVVDLTGTGSIAIDAATGIVNGGSGRLTFNDAATHSDGQINVGSGGVRFASDYTASGNAALNGDNVVGENPDIDFRGNVALPPNALAFKQNGDRLVFDSLAPALSPPQGFNSNGQLIGNVLINNVVGVQCQISDVRQTGGTYTLTIQSGSLDLASRGWVADTAATAPTPDTFVGVRGTLQLQAGTMLGCGLLDVGSNYTIDNAGLGSTITASSSGNVNIASVFTNPTNSTLVMMGAAQTLTAPSQLGNLTIGDGVAAKYLTLASNLDLAASLTIQSGSSLDVDGTNNYSIGLSGDWVNNAGSANFYPRTGTVTIERQSGIVSVYGDNTFYNFSAVLSGATLLTIRFDNLKLQSFIHNLTLRGYDATHPITLTRISNAPGNPPFSPPFVPTPFVFVPRSGDSIFWYMEIQTGASIVFNYLDIYYSNVELSPIVTAADVAATINNPHYCWRWIPGIPVLYSYTEDKDQNGKLDRIRLQTPVNLGGSFSGLRINVAGYEVAGYDWVTGSPKDFYVLLKEKPYNDTSAMPQWNFVANTTLGQTAPVFVALDPTAIGTPVDTAPPVLAYTAAVPGTTKSFLSFSEPVHSQSGAANPITSADLSFAAHGISALSAISPTGPNAREYSIDVNPVLTIGYIFNALPANGVNIANVRDSAVAAVPIGALSGWGVVDNPNYPNAWAPMPTANGEIPLKTTHRVSDVLVDVPIATAADLGYFIWPIYAKDNVDVSLSDSAIAALTPAQTAAQGIGLIRAFDGSQWLRDRNITLQAMLQPAFAGVANITLWFDSNVPAALTSPYGVWLPSFAETGFSGLAAYPDMAPWGRGASPSTGSSIGSGLYNFAIPASDPRVVSISKLDFFFTFQPSPAGEPLYALRLDLPSGAAGGVVPPDSASWQWYRSLKPFSFGIHDVTLQKGGATILNNVIDPTKGETARLSYQLSKSGAVTITVFTLDGDVVARLANVSSQAAGDHVVFWSGRNLSGAPVARGLYFIRIVAPGIDEIRKVLVVRK
jgi:fibronectin-binding autotransporter adhesin